MIFIYLKNPESLGVAICKWCFNNQFVPLIQILPRADAPHPSGRVPPNVLDAQILLLSLFNLTCLFYLFIVVIIRLIRGGVVVIYDVRRKKREGFGFLSFCFCAITVWVTQLILYWFLNLINYLS